MKYLVLLFTALLIFTTSNNAQLLLLEDFDYAAGTVLSASGWTAHSGGGTNPPTVVSPSLTFTGYPSSGIGNAAALTSSGEDINKQFSDSVTSGAVYASFMVNVTSAQTGDYFFHLGPKTMGFAFMGRVFVKFHANSNISFGLSKSSTSTSIQPSYTDSIYSTGTTYLLVLKYEFHPGVNDDTVKLFINPAVSPNEPTVANLTHGTSSANDPLDIGTVALRQGGSTSVPNLIIDGIRISSNWSSVIPVELSAFTASVSGNNVTLNWSTATETNNQGFEIQRATNGNWKTLGFVDGKGTTTNVSSYVYTDKNLSVGKTYNYRLKQIDFDGSFEYHNLSSEVIIGAPTVFSLEQNYPNPFNPETKINFSLPNNGNVKISVYNLLGQEVKTLVNGFMQAGQHSVSFNAVGLQSGMYFYKLEATGFTQTRKMTLLK